MKLYGFLLLMLLLYKPNTAFAGFWHTCSVYASPVTMEKIASVESDGNPYAINDDTSGRSYSFTTKYKAFETAEYLANQGHNLDLGLVQINIKNLYGYGISINDAFNPCYNVAIGSYILYQGYNLALRRFKNVRVALYRALEYYNSGRFYGDGKYADAVWEALN